MLGKGAILTVFGFILAFSMYQVRMSKNVMATADNFNTQYVETMVHETALSAMNFAINKVWQTNDTSGSFMVKANSCTSQVNISKVGADTTQIQVRTWGYLFDTDLQEFRKEERDMSAFFSYNMPISKYFWFTDDEKGVFWITGDTVWGPMHTNKTIKTSGNPVFYGKVTAKMGFSPDPTSTKNQADYFGGWETGIYNEIPTDMTPLVNAAAIGNAGAPLNSKCIYDIETTFDFQADGSVIRTVSGNPPDTVSLATIAPTGVIVSSADVRVKGTFNGDMTIYSQGNIWIDDDIVYADNPQTNPHSDDLLGLVAKDYVYVTDNAANNSDVNIQAAMMSIERSFKAENYNTRPIGGVINLTGSVCQYHRGPVGTFSFGHGIMTGFLKRYRFDPRFSFASPKNFPYLKSLRLVSWWE